MLTQYVTTGPSGNNVDTGNRQSDSEAYDMVAGWQIREKQLVEFKANRVSGG